MARVTNSTFFDRALIDFRRTQADIATLQTQIGSGKKLNRPSDDPAGAARVMDMNSVIARVEQYGQNAVLANQRLAFEDSTLDAVGGLLTRVKELAIAANTAIHTAQTRTAFESEVRQRLAELLDLANTTDSNGDYLFAGNRAQTRPFERLGGGVDYNGSHAVKELQVSDTRRVASSDGGDTVFVRVPGGNGSFAVSVPASNTGTGVMNAGAVVDPSAFTHHDYSIRFTASNSFDIVDDTLGVTIAAGQPFTEGESIGFDGIKTSISGTPAAGDRFDLGPAPDRSMFETLQRFIDTLALDPANAAEEAQMDQRMNDVIDSLGQAITHVLEVRTSVGARQNALESVELETENLKFELRSTISHIEDVAMDEAISMLTRQVSALQASQATFVRLSELSLFNYLR